MLIKSPDANLDAVGMQRATMVGRMAAMVLLQALWIPSISMAEPTMQQLTSPWILAQATSAATPHGEQERDSLKDGEELYRARQPGAAFFDSLKNVFDKTKQWLQDSTKAITPAPNTTTPSSEPRPATETLANDPTTQPAPRISDPAFRAEITDYCRRVQNSHYVNAYVELARRIREPGQVGRVSTLDIFFDNEANAVAHWFYQKLDQHAARLNLGSIQPLLDDIHQQVHSCLSSTLDTDLRLFFAGSDPKRLKTADVNANQSMDADKDDNLLMHTYLRQGGRRSAAYVSIMAFAFDGADAAIAESATRNLKKIQASLDDNRRLSTAIYRDRSMDQSREQDRQARLEKDRQALATHLPAPTSSTTIPPYDKPNGFDTPAGQSLFNAYQHHAWLKQCYAEREGYTQPYVTRPELDRAQRWLSVVEKQNKLGRGLHEPIQKSASQLVTQTFRQLSEQESKKTLALTLPGQPKPLSNTMHQRCREAYIGLQNQAAAIKLPQIP